MKLLDKIKDILFDEEEEVEIPVAPKITETKEVTENKKNIPTEKIVNEPKKEVENERELFRSENTFKFPLFDEEEFESTRPRKVTPKVEENNYYKREEVKPLKDYKAALEKTPEVRKMFKPSPIISPVYGILDKNYKPEDQIIVSQVPAREKSNLNVDDVRKKAFGSLDEDLEKTLNKSYEEFYQAPKLVDEIIDEQLADTKEFKTVDIKETLSDIKENLNDISESINHLETKVEKKDDLDQPRKAIDLLNEIENELNDITSSKADDFVDNDEVIEDFIDPVISEDEPEIEVTEFSVSENESTSSDELFNLIDAMYDANDKESDE